MPIRPARTHLQLPRPLLLLLAAILIAAFPARAFAASPGLVSDLAWGISDAQKTQTASAMANAGAQWTRISLGWHDLEPSKGSYSSYYLGEQDRAIQAAHNAGLKVVLDVVESPQWASGSTNKLAPPRNPQDLADFMTFIANRYRGQVQAYEIWNEENGSRFWPGGPNAAAYVGLLRASYPAIKAADPSATVVFGGLANADYHYVEQAYAAGAKGYFDVMGVHPYSCWAPEGYWWVDSNENWLAGEGPRPRADARISEYVYTGYREVHNSMVAAGDDKPIWFTEFGWSSAGTGGSCVVDQQTQASYLTRAYQIAAQDPYVQVALWYNFREDYWADPSTSWDAGFGLVHRDFTPKPALAAFQAYATAPTLPPADSTSSSGSTAPTGSTAPSSTPPPPSTDPAPTGTKRHKKRLARKARRLSARRG
jgi:hypothetical protein